MTKKFKPSSKPLADRIKQGLTVLLFCVSFVMLFFIITDLSPHTPLSEVARDRSTPSPLSRGVNSPKPAEIKTPPSATAPVIKNLLSIPSVSSLIPTTQVIDPQTLQGESFLGHLLYAEPSQTDLIVLTSYGDGAYQRLEFLNLNAAIALMKMIYSARNHQVWLIPVSGFRSFDQQKKLFDDQVQRRGSTEAAAKISAPPGYSEHHTGYAVDLADGHAVNQDLSLKFIETDTYRWLQQNAARFGFEQSFPAKNSQGVSFEPWHWRFVGTSQANQVFTKARKAG